MQGKRGTAAKTSSSVHVSLLPPSCSSSSICACLLSKAAAAAAAAAGGNMLGTLSAAVLTHTHTHTFIMHLAAWSLKPGPCQLAGVAAAERWR
jgi:hypothetical protein